MSPPSLPPRRTFLQRPAWRRLAGVCCVALTGCSGAVPDEPSRSRTDEEVRAARQQAFERKQLRTVSADEEQATVGEVPQSVLDEVRKRLGASTGVDPESFEVARAEQHEWPDGSLGCPQPDLVYPQRPTRGYWIVLRDARREYDYRVSESGMIVRCEAMSLENPPVD